MKRLSVCLAAAALMGSASVLAQYMKPTQHLADMGPKLELAQMMPEHFGDWTVDHAMDALVVSAEQQAMLAKLYSQTYSRTYVNSRSGERIMVSIAYGADQRDSMQLHYPEVCYPAQGFQLTYNQQGSLPVNDGVLPVRRLVAQAGATRVEPITYWILIGDKPTTSGIDKKFAEMRYTLRGVIPDGILFRVSSIDSDQDAAFKSQEIFVNALNSALPASARARLFGQPDPGSRASGTHEADRKI